VVWPLIPDPGASERRDFDPYAAYVLKRWHDGERNGTRIFQEIAAASVTQAHNAWYTRFLKTLKRTEVKTSAEIPQVLHDTSTAAVCLFMRHPENLEISPPSGSGGTSPGSSSRYDNVSLDAGLSPAARANGKGSGSLPGEPSSTSVTCPNCKALRMVWNRIKRLCKPDERSPSTTGRSRAM